ncbi:MAG TPA: four helix bundle protein [Chitinophagaceae bacterium]|nr:four helix bundle protein [Chitinophagaceae bacterium]
MIRLEDLEVYKVAMEIGELVWTIVDKWPYFQKDTLGKQLTRAADSIALNIGEGYGRFYFKENKNFCYYSRGSAYETISALAKAVNRKLISAEDYSLLKTKFERYFKLMNPYIKSIGSCHPMI